MIYIDSADSLDAHFFAGVPKEDGVPAEECSRSQDLECNAQEGARRGATAFITQDSGCCFSMCLVGSGNITIACS